MISSALFHLHECVEQFNIATTRLRSRQCVPFERHFMNWFRHFDRRGSNHYRRGRRSGYRRRWRRLNWLLVVIRHFFLPKLGKQGLRSQSVLRHRQVAYQPRQQGLRMRMCRPTRRLPLDTLAAIHRCLAG